MISLAIAISVFLALRLISAYFIGRVLYIQYGLLKKPIDPDLRNFRAILFALSIVVFLGNLVPIAVDIYSLLFPVPRPAFYSLLSVSYGLSAALTSVASALLIWLLYKIAGASNK